MCLKKGYGCELPNGGWKRLHVEELQGLYRTPNLEY